MKMSRNRVNTRTVAILGVGVIGGSLGMALREKGYTVYGYSPSNNQAALTCGAVDVLSTRLDRAVEQADILVLATPVGAYRSLLEQLQPYWQANWVLTDVGSTKQSVYEDVCSVLNHRQQQQMVYGHPIAGREQSGVEHAHSDLFQQAWVVLCEGVPSINKEAYALIEKMWADCGARCTAMELEQHDAILAQISHLPHVLAYVLVDALVRSDSSDLCFKLAAGGFADFSRIASSSPRMWTDILQANRVHISQVIKDYIQRLKQIDKMISQSESGSDRMLYEWLYSTKKRRDEWLRSKKKW